MASCLFSLVFVSKVSSLKKKKKKSHQERKKERKFFFKPGIYRELVLQFYFILFFKIVDNGYLYKKITE